MINSVKVFKKTIENINGLTMRIHRAQIIFVFVIFFNIFLYFYWKSLYSFSWRDCNLSGKYFQSTAELLLSLHDMPDLGDPKSRIGSIPPFEYQTTKQERLIMYRLLAVFDKTMKENGIPFFIHSGTLLGSYRHHDFIPWDDDIDVFVSAAERSQLEKVFYNKNVSNLVLYYTPTHDKLYFNNDSVSGSIYGWKWPYIDISFYNTNETHLFDLSPTYGQYDTYPKSVIFPLTNRPLFTMNLPSPKDTFAYCVWSYGYSDDCVMNFYSHITENLMTRYVKVKCKVFASKYPYVKRYRIGNSVIEELLYRGKVIQRIKVNEPLYAISESFELALQKGYLYPTNVSLPEKYYKGIF